MKREPACCPSLPDGTEGFPPRNRQISLPASRLRPTDVCEVGQSLRRLTFLRVRQTRATSHAQHAHETHLPGAGRRQFITFIVRNVRYRAVRSRSRANDLSRNRAGRPHLGRRPLRFGKTRSTETTSESGPTTPKSGRRELATEGAPNG